MPPKATRKRNKATASSSSNPKRAKNAAPEAAVNGEAAAGRVLVVEYDKKKGNGSKRKAIVIQLGAKLQGVCTYGTTEVGWRVLRQGESAPQLPAAEREARGLDIDDASLANSSDTTNDAGSTAAASNTSSQSNTSTTRLCLTYRSLQDDGKAIPAPKPGSVEQKSLMKAKAKKAIAGHQSKIQELGIAIESNRVAFESLTSVKDAAPEDITRVAMERHYLKSQLQTLQAEDAKAYFELQGEQWSFEVEVGQHALLDRLPGRPSVVWLETESKVPGSLQSWKTTHNVEVKGTCGFFALCAALG